MVDGEASTRVVIVRDRAGCGGGIYALFEALRPHFPGHVTFVDAGRPHPYYGGSKAPWWQRGGLRLPVDAFVLAWAIVRHQPDLVHLNTGLDKEERSLKRDAVNLLIAKALGCRVLVQWHGWDHPASGGTEFPGGNEGWLCKTYQRAAAHVVLASAFRENLQRWGFRVPVHRVTTVVTPEVLEADPGPAVRSRVPMLLFLSRIEKTKGLWELLDAYAELKRRKISCGLTIAGDGPDLAALKKRAAELGLADVLFPGFVSGKEKLECFRQASVFCFPSYSEGMPLAVLEAMAMGLPVVSSGAGALREVLLDDINGFVVPFRSGLSEGLKFSAKDLADPLERLIRDQELCRQMSVANRGAVARHYTPERVTAALSELYAATR
ncbi:MAG: glycosyltransferase family 1 protein [Alphaproteobacteria bacterium]|nr:MAG: glycosyltransferase family 1 protein [Alphaproteobacteria bacterium]